MKTISRISLEAAASVCSKMDFSEMASCWGGGNNYSVDANGNFVLTGENDYDYDVVSAGSNSYNVNGSLSVTSYTTSGSDEGTQIKGGDYDLFKFLADNTDVEWGAVFSGGVYAQGDVDCMIQTTHDDDECIMQIDTSEPYDTMVHSHTKNGFNGATDEDKATWSKMAKDTPIRNYGIYFAQSGNTRDYTV